MDRHTFQVIAAIGALVHGGIYLVLVYVFALLTHNTMSGLLAIGAAGITYLSYLSHFCGERMLANALAALSLVCAVTAGGHVLVS
jgi:hypothetical protein